ncbi:MAG: hypothetical protein A2951_01400 [Candidatus Buchananbacteria bacterium RIFCSPLOWO2_01_FULL_56_15]|uniref:POTRA domain-containing protein n=3 Tax=Candidatus Buchananiibacteriota TaxID=1817903 RepID=A0A1G1YR36_9BACT|nr:MAG: hypothetical protein A2951_01400 [Candidatus Buchananbacteria bacterium RIFCSPLOWO2_01_FULL_56_15]
MQTKRDYHRQEFRNPFFAKRQAEGHRRPFIFRLAAVVVFLAFVIWLQRSGTFQIQTIEVRGEPVVGEQEIKDVVSQQLGQRRWLIFSQRNIFFFNTEKTERALAEQYGEDYLTVKKKYFQMIVVSINADISRIVWSTNQQTFYLDANGVALREAADPQSTVEFSQGTTEVVRTRNQFGDHPLVFDESGTAVVIGQEATSPVLVAFIATLTDTVRARADFEITHYSIVNPYADWLTLQTTSGWAVYVKTTDSAEAQVSRLLMVLSQKVPDRSKLEYVDLRYGDKVFYK